MESVGPTVAPGICFTSGVKHLAKLVSFCPDIWELTQQRALAWHFFIVDPQMAPAVADTVTYLVPTVA